MKKYFCDKCERPLPGEHSGVTIAPGYVGDKQLCDPCWKQWKTVVYQFFKVNG
jgi:hypothetical protein